MSNTEFVQIKDLKAGMKNINAIFIVLEVGGPTVTMEGREVRTLRVADASAAVNLSVWDAAGALLLPGDIVRLWRGYAAVWRSQLTLYSGKCGDLQKVGEFCMLFNEQLNMSEPLPATPAPTPAPPLDARYSSATSTPAPAAAATNEKHLHKTYSHSSRGGRAHHRNNNRR